MNILQFYQENRPDLDVIPHPNWRQYRFLLPDGGFLKVPDVIRTPKDLQRWLIEKQPLDAYYSVAKYLNPRTVGPKTHRVSDNLFLGADLVFDIDERPFTPKNMEKAKNTVLNLLAWLDGKQISVNYIAFSGSKGFHVVCQDPFLYDHENPLDREHAAKENRTAIVGELDAQGIAIDAKVTKDTRRIFRVPGTINSKTGLECTVLERADLEKPFKEILKKSRRVRVSAFPIRKEMTVALQAFRTIGGLHRWNARSAPTHYFTSLLSSRVTGTKLHVPIIILKTRHTGFAERLLRRIQEKYRLSDVYVFQGDPVWAMTVDALQASRVQRILEAAQAQNAGFFKKHGKAFVRVAPKTDPNLETLADAPRLTATLSAPTPSHYPASHAHQAFLEQCGIVAAAFGKKAGKTEFQLRHAVMQL